MADDEVYHARHYHSHYKKLEAEAWRKRESEIKRISEAILFQIKKGGEPALTRILAEMLVDPDPLRDRLLHGPF